MAYVLMTVSIHQEVITVIVLLDTAFNLTSVIVQVGHSMIKLHHIMALLLYGSETKTRINVISHKWQCVINLVCITPLYYCNSFIINTEDAVTMVKLNATVFIFEGMLHV